MAHFFVVDVEYTVLVPIDFAFQRWHPIDWGFYPFSVPEFTEYVLKNHFIIGKYKQNSLQDGEEVLTLGGNKLKFTTKRKYPLYYMGAWCGNNNRWLHKIARLGVY